MKILLWIKRAIPGNWIYKSYPPISHIIDHKKAEDMERKARSLREEVDMLERLLTEPVND